MARGLRQFLWMTAGFEDIDNFVFNDTATTEIYTLSLHDALPIYLANSVSNPLHQGIEISPSIDGNDSATLARFRPSVSSSGETGRSARRAPGAPHPPSRSSTPPPRSMERSGRPRYPRCGTHFLKRV